MLRSAQAHVYRARTKRPVPSEGGSETMKQQNADYQVVSSSKYWRFVCAGCERQPGSVVAETTVLWMRVLTNPAHTHCTF